jgi:DNA-binding NarL/FixJ family response regulator
MIRLLVADDEALIRAGFRALLGAESDIRVVGEAADGKQAVEAARKLRPSVVLMDIRMPIMDGIEATGMITGDSELSGVRVIMTTSLEGEEQVLSSVRAGARGFILKASGRDELARAVRVVDAGEALLAPSVTRHLIDEFRRGYQAPSRPDPDILSLLTLRERDVLALVAAGLSNDEIAGRLFISPATVKTHIGRTLSKVGLRTRAQLVVLAYQTGLASVGGAELARGR